MDKLRSYFNRERIILVGVIIFLLIAGIVLRTRMYSDYLTFNDSYRYLVKADSFTHDTAQEYLTQKSTAGSEWGYPLLVGLVNAPFNFSDEKLVTLARYVNIILSLAIGVVYLLYMKKHRGLALCLFLSPIFVTYSSYVIAEYFTLLLIMLVLALLHQIPGKDAVTDPKYRLKSIGYSLYIGLMLGLLPLARVEMFVISALFLFYLGWINRTAFITALITAVLTYVGLFTLVFAHLDHLDSLPNLFLSILKSPLMVHLIIMVGAAYVYFKKIAQNYHRLFYIFTGVYTLWFTLGLVFSVHFKTAYDMDRILYTLIVVMLTIISFYGYIKKVKTSKLFDLLCIILMALSWIYYIFDNTVDRYALNIFGLALIVIGTFLSETNVLSDLKAYFGSLVHLHNSTDNRLEKYQIKGVFAAVFIVTLGFFYSIYGHFMILNEISPKSTDYRQYIVHELQYTSSSGNIYVSEDLYLPYMFFTGTKPRLINQSIFFDMKPGDRIILDAYVMSYNTDLYNVIMLSPGKFTIERTAIYQKPVSKSNNEGIAQDSAYLVEVK
jgi:hypothetical protein